MPSNLASTPAVATRLTRPDAQEIWEGHGMTGPAQIRFCGVYAGKCDRVDMHKYLDPDQVD